MNTVELDVPLCAKPIHRSDLDFRLEMLSFEVRRRQGFPISTPAPAWPSASDALAHIPALTPTILSSGFSLVWQITFADH